MAKEMPRKFGRELFGLFLLFWALLLLLSIVTFDANDPSLNHVVSGGNEVKNSAGLFGAYAAGLLNDVFGIGAFLWPALFAALGAAYVSPVYALRWWRWCGTFLLTIVLLVTGSAFDLSIGDICGGGMVGNSLYGNTSLYLSPVGSGLLWIFVLLIGLQLCFDISWFALAALARSYVSQRLRRASSSEKTPEASYEIVTSQTEKKSSSFLQALRSLRDKSRTSSAGSFWSRLRDRLGNIRPVTDEAMPEVYDEAAPAPSSRKSGRSRAEKRAARNDDPARDDLFMPADDSAPPFVPDEAAPARAAVRPDADAPALPAADAPEVSDAHAALPGVEVTAAPQEGEVLDVTAQEVPPAPARPAARPAGPGLTQTVARKVKTALGRKAPIPLPGLDLLVPPEPATDRHQDIPARAKALMDCLHDFDIQAELVRVTPGPVVTMYEVRPAPGIRVSRIANLSGDIALSLKAIAVRIQAPIPGQDTVGIEIPNAEREIVNFRELVASDTFRKGCGPLTMVLGKDIAGKPVLADLTKMPHLLVAGATGAGKSVCLNCLLVSLLYRTQPDEMKLLLVDPKRVELSVYEDEPHLVHPIVKEISDAKNALDWAVHEMDRRFDAMARLGVRNISGYNQKLTSYGSDLPPDLSDLEPIPYLVIVIDEMADLILTCGRDVETSIVRLAQLARAAGIHMIFATQRPSVNVVTGLIKANFLCRIAFQVSGSHDSRTILDQVGAEHLLGKGDMLFKSGGARLQRLHAPYISDDEVHHVVEHWKRHQRPSYQVDFATWGLEAANTGNGRGSTGGGNAANDPLYASVQAFVLEQGKASISLVQRRFNIGFNRAARIVEQLEQDGILPPASGSKPRTVVK